MQLNLAHDELIARLNKQFRDIEDTAFITWIKEYRNATKSTLKESKVMADNEWLKRLPLPERLLT
jgi:hypothetical protein